MGLFVEILDFAGAYWPHLLLFLLGIRLTSNHFKFGVHGIPGPFLASLTDVWLFVHYIRGQGPKEYLLHRKYKSPLLRLGPCTVSVSDAQAVRVIYGWKPVFKKSRLYIAQSYTSAQGDIVPNLASTMDEELHARLRRPVAHAYAMSTLVEFEPLVDSTFETFVNQVKTRFVETGLDCDLSKWLQMYAFDIIGEITFSKRFGFLEQGKDIEHMMKNVAASLNYAGIVGQLPTWDEYLRVKNDFLRKLRPGGNVVNWTVKQVREHVAHGDRKCPDFLTRFIQAKEKYPDIMTEAQLTDFANTNVGAGSDTTAIALRELVFQILTHPTSYTRIMEEVKSTLKARPKDQGFQKSITWSEGSKMLYLQACIKECLRYHSPLGQLIPREVPEGGYEICGRFFPGGTVVGCNAWTVHRDKKIYGEDADIWRPERWLEADESHLRDMENLNFAFGGGPRVCIGKNIAMLEVSKFIPEFFRRFEVHILDPKQYGSIDGWLVSQTGLIVTIKLRDPKMLEV